MQQGDATSFEATACRSDGGKAAAGRNVKHPAHLKYKDENMHLEPLKDERKPDAAVGGRKLKCYADSDEVVPVPDTDPNIGPQWHRPASGNMGADLEY